MEQVMAEHGSLLMGPHNMRGQSTDGILKTSNLDLFFAIHKAFSPRSLMNFS